MYQRQNDYAYAYAVPAQQNNYAYAPPVQTAAPVYVAQPVTYHQPPVEKTVIYAQYGAPPQQEMYRYNYEMERRRQQDQDVADGCCLGLCTALLCCCLIGN